jgi:hypothetical protein
MIALQQTAKEVAMDAPTTMPVRNRYLSHTELVHRPGERQLAHDFLALLGIDLEDAMGGRFMMAVVDKESYVPQYFENFFGGSEVHCEQWAFEEALIAAIDEGGELAERFAAYQDRLDRDPTSGMHIGIHYPEIPDWEATVARLQGLEEEFPHLKGRVRIASLTRPGDPGSFPPLYQCFVWTDIISAGSLAIGQRWELSAIDAEYVA